MAEPEFKEIDDDEQDEIEDNITDPFDPRDIDFSVEQKSLDTIFARIKHGEIDLNTEFQRGGNLWTPPTMSRLIESVLVRFPLPAFYFDAGNDERWLVVDGLQRLCSFKRFVVDCEEKGEEPPLKLSGLEFLKKYNGLTFSDLPYNMKRRIKETQITTYLIKPGTPKEVKYSIFSRINTGGLVLKAQEIRHALNQDGYMVGFLKTVSDDQVFKRVVNISSKRMQDRELILRHMAFRLHPFKEYKPPMKRFLDNAMDELNKHPTSDLNLWKEEFILALEASERIFGEYVFSKSIVEPQRKPTLNRGLFEVITILFAQMPDEQKQLLFLFKEKFIEDFKILLKDPGFNNCISSATTESAAVKERFERINRLIQGYIQQ